MQEILHSV